MCVAEDRVCASMPEHMALSCPGSPLHTPDVHIHYPAPCGPQIPGYAFAIVPAPFTPI